MKHFALTTTKPCRHCGKFHGYITYKHQIIIANRDSKFLIEQFARKYPNSEVVEVDLNFLISKDIPVIDVIKMMREPIKSKTNGSSN